MGMILTAIVVVLALAVIFGAILGYASIRFRVEGDPIVDQINALLPQTQCGQCGHPGCKPYAEGIANGEPINKCPPGGEATIQALADLLDVEPLPLDAEHGEEKPRMVAYIREAECIGCTKCIQACPVDAILGAAKQMHTVIVDECDRLTSAWNPARSTVSTWCRCPPRRPPGNGIIPCPAKR